MDRNFKIAHYQPKRYEISTEMCESSILFTVTIFQNGLKLFVYRLNSLKQLKKKSEIFESMESLYRYVNEHQDLVAVDTFAKVLTLNVKLAVGGAQVIKALSFQLEQVDLSIIRVRHNRKQRYAPLRLHEEYPFICKALEFAFYLLLLGLLGDQYLPWLFLLFLARMLFTRCVI